MSGRETQLDGVAASASPIDALWYTRCAVPTPLGIAAQLGWLRQEFAADHIDIRAVVESEDLAQRESHYDHSVENSFRLGGNIPAIWAKSTGRDTRLIGLSWTDEFQALITLPDSGIRSPKDLRGRRIGLPRVASSEYVAHGTASALRGILATLALGGLERRDVEIVDLLERRNSIAEQGTAQLSGSQYQVPRRSSGSRPLLALVRGEVDAIYVKGPRGLQLGHQIGAHVIADLGAHPDPWVRTNNCTPRTLTVSGALLDSHPELVTRFLGRVLEAGAWAKSHPEEAVRYIGRETATSEAWVRYGYGKDVHRHLEVDLDDVSVTAITQFSKFLSDHGFLAQPVDVARWIDRGPLSRVKDIANRSAA